MKNRVIAVISTLQGMLSAYQIPLGGQTEVQFKLALQELEDVAKGLEVPAEPVAVAVPAAAIEDMEAQAQHNAEQAQRAAEFVAISQRLDTQQQALQGLFELMKAQAEAKAAAPTPAPEPTATPEPKPESAPEAV